MNWRERKSGVRNREAAVGDRKRLFSRSSAAESRFPIHAPLADEALIVDVRGQVRPAQQVEDKLLSLLKSVFVPLSQVRMSSLNDGRGRLGHC